MTGPGWEEACSGCTYTGDTFDRAVEHLPHRDVGFVAISRAPVEAIEAYKARMGWSFDWVSCGRTTFNQDPRRRGRRAATPTGVELHGLSAFAREGDDVYHTYSTFDRGTDVLQHRVAAAGSTPLGRGGEHPNWPRRRYEYA